MNMPVIIEPGNLEEIIFNFFEINTFFVVGQKNIEFDGTSEDQIIFEKFFINHGDDLTS
jgi:hypothetical protein